MNPEPLDVGAIARMVQQALSPGGDPTALAEIAASISRLPLPDDPVERAKLTLMASFATSMKALMSAEGSADVQAGLASMRGLLNDPVLAAEPRAQELLAIVRLWAAMLSMAASASGHQDTLAAVISALLYRADVSRPDEVSRPDVQSAEIGAAAIAEMRAHLDDIDVERFPELAATVRGASAAAAMLEAAARDDEIGILTGLGQVEQDLVIPEGLPASFRNELALARGLLSAHHPGALPERADAEAALRSALDLAGPTDPARPHLLVALARARLLDGIETRDPRHFEQAQQLLEEALELLPAGDRRRAEALAGLGNVGMLATVTTDGGLADPERAALAREALDAAVATLGEEIDVPAANTLTARLQAHLWHASSTGDTSALDPIVQELAALTPRLAPGGEAAGIVTEALRRALAVRGLVRGDLLDRDVAALMPGSAFAGADILIPGFGSLSLVFRLLQAQIRMQGVISAAGSSIPEVSELTALAGELAAIAEALPPESRFLAAATHSRALVEVMIGGVTGQRERVRSGLSAAVGAARSAAASPDWIPALASNLLALTGSACAAAALARVEPDQIEEADGWLDEGVALLREAMGTEPSDVAARSIGAVLGRILYARHVRRCPGAETAHDSGDLAEVEELLAATQALGGEFSRGQTAAEMGTILASVVRSRAWHLAEPGGGGERAAAQFRRAREIARTALPLHGRAVVLQTGTGRALTAARSAARAALQLTHWCLADGDLNGAVSALEAGRGLVLAAATSGDEVSRLLGEAGRPDLLGRWARQRQESAGSPADLGVPDLSTLTGLTGALAAAGANAGDLDLRHEVLTAIDAVAPEGWWVRGSTVPEVAGAAARAGAAAIAYLVPGTAEPALLEGQEFGPRTGAIVLVTAAGAVHHLPAPGLGDLGHDSPLADLAAFTQTGPDGAEAPAGRHVLDLVGEWAWQVAIGPLLQALPGPDPRVVLVPVGPLAIVPWHAARAGEGPDPYACQRSVISYASSARELAEALERPALPWSSGVLMVTNTIGDLHWSSAAASAVRRDIHPGARLLGSPPKTVDGPAASVGVLDALPGAGTHPVAVLDLSCHARTDADPARAHVTLGEYDQLSLSRILDHAGRRASGSPGGVVVLAGCSSALSVADHDEALTLASGMLAAGARGVIGSRWPVSDVLCAAFTYVLHRQLADGQDAPGDPARALAAAQRWLLTDHRPAPPTGPGHPAFYPAAARVTSPADPRILATWAAFAHHGA